VIETSKPEEASDLRDYGRNQPLALLQKRFVVSAVKSFFISVSPANTILRIQKIDYFSYRLFLPDTQNRFSKKNRSPDLGTLALSSWASSPRPPRTPCRHRAPSPSRFRLEPPLETAEHHRRLRPPLSACHGTRHLAQWTRTEMSGGREREGIAPSRGELT
jgi:hypothetical protein